MIFARIDAHMVEINHSSSCMNGEMAVGNVSYTDRGTY